MIACILTFGFGIRILGLGVGLPDSPDPREVLISHEILNLINFTAPPEIYNWPGTAWFYLIALIGKLLSIVGFHLTESRVILLARFVNTLLSTATLWFTYRLGASCYNKRTGQIAAGLLAVTMLHATNESRFALVDIPATFCVTLFLWLLIRDGAQLQRKTLVSLGVVSGIGFAVKFTTAFAVLSALFFLSHTHLRSDSNRQTLTSTQPMLKKKIKKSITTLISAAIITFTLSCPYWLIDLLSPVWNLFFEDFWYETTHYQRGHFGLFTATETKGLQRFTYLWTLLKWGMGWPLAFLVSVSILYALVIASPWKSHINQFNREKYEKHKRSTRALLVFIIPYLLFIGAHKVKFTRHLLILYPVLAVLTGAMLAQLQNTSIRAISLFGLLFGGAVAIYSVIYTAAFASVLLSSPTRVEASEWVTANIPQEESISCAPEILFDWLLPELDRELIHTDADWILILIPNVEVFQKYVPGQQGPHSGQRLENPDWYPLEGIELEHNLAFYAPILGKDLSLLDKPGKSQNKYELRRIFRRTPQFLGIHISDTGAPFPMRALVHPEIRLYRQRH